MQLRNILIILDSCIFCVSKFVWELLTLVLHYNLSLLQGVLPVMSLCNLRISGCICAVFRSPKKASSDQANTAEHLAPAAWGKHAIKGGMLQFSAGSFLGALWHSAVQPCCGQAPVTGPS